MEGIYAKHAPHFAVDFVEGRIYAVKLDEDNDGGAGDVPATSAESDTVREGEFGGRLQEGLCLFKIRRWGSIGPDVWPDEYKIIAKLLFEHTCFSGKDGVDTADFVAYFPACLEKQFTGEARRLVHSLFTFTFRSLARGFGRLGRSI